MRGLVEDQTSIPIALIMDIALGLPVHVELPQRNMGPRSQVFLYPVLSGFPAFVQTSFLLCMFIVLSLSGDQSHTAFP